ncbi:MAG TPA: hypothetical protein VK696_07765, partial [Steroidobacteraceae bacterium]|nr:hypothetical protein [Steroidobacteraceae bacterium]
MRRSAWLAISVAVIWTASFAQEGPPPQAPPAGGDPAARAAARDRINAAQAAEWNKNPAPTDPRDFSGVWWTRGYDRTFRPVADHPMSPGEAASLLPMTPLEAASRQHHLDMEKAGTPIADAPTQCFPHGIPRLMASPYPIEFVFAPGLITILHEVAHNVRFIHLDGKPVSADTPR